MRYQVPQFIDVEDKIFGPLTLKQFLYLAGGGAAIFLLYTTLPFFLFIIFAAPIGIFAAALAFYKVNNQPFIKVTENAIAHFTKTKVYTWKKRMPKKAQRSATAKETGPKKKEEITAPTLTKSRLNELAWSLDIKNKIDHDGQ